MAKTKNVTSSEKFKSIGNINFEPVYKVHTEIKSLEITEGRFLEYIDVERKQKVCVVGTYIVKELYGGMSPVGNTIKIGNEVYSPMKVVNKNPSYFP